MGELINDQRDGYGLPFYVAHALKQAGVTVTPGSIETIPSPYDSLARNVATCTATIEATPREGDQPYASRRLVLWDLACNIWFWLEDAHRTVAPALYRDAQLSTFTVRLTSGGYMADLRVDTTTGKILDEWPEMDLKGRLL
jgi:hypothetical protein